MVSFSGNQENFVLPPYNHKDDSKALPVENSFTLPPIVTHNSLGFRSIEENKRYISPFPKESIPIPPPKIEFRDINSHAIEPLNPMNNNNHSSNFNNNASNNNYYCNVRIIHGRYDSIGMCWLDEGQKKIHIEVSTNIPKQLMEKCFVYCIKETNNKKVLLFSVPQQQQSSSKKIKSEINKNNNNNEENTSADSQSEHFEYWDKSYKYVYRFHSGFPLKSGITHSALRFVVVFNVLKDEKSNEVIQYTFVNDETFYMYSKLPETVKMKKKLQKEPNSGSNNNNNNNTNLNNNTSNVNNNGNNTTTMNHRGRATLPHAGLNQTILIKNMPNGTNVNGNNNNNSGTTSLIQTHEETYLPNPIRVATKSNLPISSLSNNNKSNGSPCQPIRSNSPIRISYNHSPEQQQTTNTGNNTDFEYIHSMLDSFKERLSNLESLVINSFTKQNNIIQEIYKEQRALRELLTFNQEEEKRKREERYEDSTKKQKT
ncbi:hypothetical protein ABK040_004515 [Willaertia magna]